MPVAIFGITNDALNVAASLIGLMLIALYIALVVYTFLDSRRRISDPVIITCATVGALIPFIGTAVYCILRPPEFLEDARERQLEIKAAELRVRQLGELSCPNCDFPVEKNYLRCPNCERRLKDPCHNCGKPVDPRWQLCPYCETALPGRARSPQGGGDERSQRRPQRPSGRSGGSPPRQQQGERQPPAAAQRAPRRPRQQPAAADGGAPKRADSGAPRQAPDAPQRPRPQAPRAPAADDERGRSSSPDSPPIASDQ